MTTLTREKTHAVVASLARGRSVAMTAERHHVPAGVVQLLRDNYGPDLPRLEAAARELAKAPTASTATHTSQPTENPMTAPPHTDSREAAPPLAHMRAALDHQVDGITDPRILKLHQRAVDTLAALGDALNAHRKAAKINAEIAELEARLAAARNERAKITGATIPGKRGGSTSLGPGVAKAVRTWAAANGVDAGTTGRVPRAAVDAWRAAGSPLTS